MLGPGSETRLRLGAFRIETENLDVELGHNASLFDQVLANLVRNALDAMSESSRGNTVRVVAERHTDGVLVVVEDDGPGVPEALRERIFEEGFSTKANDAGLGLGLWLCRNIAMSAAGGSLTLAPSATAKGGGARFEWLIPEPKEEASATPPDSSPVRLH